jgi:hypothetical protein
MARTKKATKTQLRKLPKAKLRLKAIKPLTERQLHNLDTSRYAPRTKLTKPEAWRIVPGPEQINTIRRIIKSEPLMVGSALVCHSAGHCAMGALMFAVGVPNHVLFSLDYRGLGSSFTQPLRDLLYEYFRIDGDDVHKIITANDSIDDSKEVVVGKFLSAHPTREELRNRRQEVLDAIDTIEKDSRPRHPRLTFYKRSQSFGEGMYVASINSLRAGTDY